MKKIMKWIGIVLGGLVGLIVLTGVVLYPIGLEKLARTYHSIAVETIQVSSGLDAIARGKHIATIWACTKCHGGDLSGTLMTNDPIAGSIPIMGSIPASNLTSGKGGIGQFYTDTDWVRAVRHGVKPDGQVEIFMNDYSTMSDRDLGDLLAYLKQIPPVDADYPASSYGPILPIAPAIGIFTPAAELIDHKAPRPAEPVPAGATIEYGKYLSALCRECHSQNLAGKLAEWKQADFIRTLRTGVLLNGNALLRS